jgi:2Fe-2S ferredoxin
MPLLTISNLPGACMEVSSEHSLLRGLQDAGFDWMHACGAKGRCTTCRLQIRSGMQNLLPPTPAELRYQTAGRLRTDERLACQARVLTGEVEGRVPFGTQLPHVRYQDEDSCNQ